MQSEIQMTWLAIPIIGFIIILCVVVKGYTDEQAKEAALAKFREKREPTLIGIDDEDDCYDIECETSDEPILKRNLNETD